MEHNVHRVCDIDSYPRSNSTFSIAHPSHTDNKLSYHIPKTRKKIKVPTTDTTSEQQLFFIIVTSHMCMFLCKINKLVCT
jgi:hypothetical protein